MELIKVADLVQEYKIDGDTQSTSLLLERSITENSVVRVWLSGDFSEQTAEETYTLKINDLVIYSQQAATGQDTPVSVKEQADFLGEFTIPNELIGESNITITGITSPDVNNGHHPAARAWIEVWVLKEFANLEGTVALSGRVINIKSEITAHIMGISNFGGAVMRISFATSEMKGVSTAVSAKAIKRIIAVSKASGIGRVIINADAWRFKGIRANLHGKSELAFFSYNRDIQQDIRSYMPLEYDMFELVHYMRIAIGNEFTRLNAIIQNLLQQNSISSSTWGVELREKLADLQCQATFSGMMWSTINKTLEQRKEQLKSLLAAETFKLANIEKVIGIKCKSTGRPHEYMIDVLLLGVRGEPENLQEIKKQIDKVVPSHFNYKVNFSYLTWGEVKQAMLTWGQAKQFTAKELKTAFLIEVV